MRCQVWEIRLCTHTSATYVAYMRAMLKDAGARVKGFESKRKSLGILCSLDRKFLTERRRNGTDSNTVEGSGSDEPVAGPNKRQRRVKRASLS